ncbi:MAG: Carbohydrate-selective porin OprB [Phenylobacterium sp.]|nr:Carbohydrate-selective porin OprB [Phenylobacterium sp.]
MLLAAGAARAQDPSPPAPLTLEVRESVDFWRNTQGGVGVGNTTLNKLQVSAGFDGDTVGWSGFKAYLSVFKTNTESLSLARTGDIQTASNIEAQHITRLFEAWVRQDFGDEDTPGWVALRGGLLDLNGAFDSIGPAGLFLNSSHGIGPDLSHSGVSGPSIFPVSGPAVQVDWRPTGKLVTHLGVFAEPDPARLHDFMDLHLSYGAGAIVIAQADYALTRDAQASLGVWRYTGRQASVADPTLRFEPRAGVYGFVQGPAPLPGGPSGWLRAGMADGRVQTVSAYFGGGLVWRGLLAGRKQDRFGLAVAHAVISGPARRTQDLPGAETTFEASYSFKLGPHLHLQPDVQHIIHPALGPHLPDATAVGLRVVLFGRALDPRPEDD